MDTIYRGAAKDITIHILRKDNLYGIMRRGVGFVATASRALELGAKIRDMYAEMPTGEDKGPLSFAPPDNHHLSQHNGLSTLTPEEQRDFFQGLGRNL